MSSYVCNPMNCDSLGRMSEENAALRSCLEETEEAKTALRAENERLKAVAEISVAALQRIANDCTGQAWTIAIATLNDLAVGALEGGAE